jgi:hypothetical protein
LRTSLKAGASRPLRFLSHDATSQFACDSFGRALAGRVRIRIECRCAEHGAPVGRSPPRSTTRKRTVCREGGRKRSRLGEFLRPGPRARPFSFLRATRACTCMRSLNCVKRKLRKLRASASHTALTRVDNAHSVLLAPSTERPRLMALRVAVASAKVSRIAGRRRHRLGAFLMAGGNAVSPRRPPSSAQRTAQPSLASRPAQPASGRGNCGSRLMVRGSSARLTPVLRIVGPTVAI